MAQTSKQVNTVINAHLDLRNMKIKKLTIWNLKEIKRLAKENNYHTTSLDRWRIMIGLFILKKIEGYVAESNKRIVGFAYATHMNNNLAICIDSIYRNKHVGYLLLDSLKSNYSKKEINLTVKKDNRIAIYLYKKIGFKQVSRVINMKLKLK